AQDVAGLQPGSGLWYRLILTAMFVPVGVHHVWRYATRVRADPSSSLVADIIAPAGSTAHETTTLTGTHRLALVAVAITIAVLLYGLLERGWYLVEMSALFLALAVALAIVGRLHPDRAAKVFGVGPAELTVTALLIGFARAIQVVLDDGGVIDTIVHGLSVPLQSLGPSLAAVGMLVVQTLTNFFIPSG